MRPALLRVDLREGVALLEISSAAPPLLLERLDRLRCAVPSPLTPAVAAPTLRSMLCALTFFGFAWLLLTCCSARYRSALVGMVNRITGRVRECTCCLARSPTMRNRWQNNTARLRYWSVVMQIDTPFRGCARLARVYTHASPCYEADGFLLGESEP